MSTGRAKRWLEVGAVWLVISGGLAVLGKHYEVFGLDRSGGGAGPTTKNGGGPPPATGWTAVRSLILRFRPGTAVLMDPLGKLPALARESQSLGAGHRVRLVGHTSPGSDPDGERRLTQEQLDAVALELRFNGVAVDRAAQELTDKPDENGSYGTMTCTIEKRTN